MLVYIMCSWLNWVLSTVYMLITSSDIEWTVPCVHWWESLLLAHVLLVGHPLEVLSHNCQDYLVCNYIWNSQSTIFVNEFLMKQNLNIHVHVPKSWSSALKPAEQVLFFAFYRQMGTSVRQAWIVSHAQGEDAWSTNKILYQECVQDINSFCISYALPSRSYQLGKSDCKSIFTC